ncbi:MAG: S8 family serine peptidase [Akkermansiaceae bacterium]|nr:S8 family serine peptidase [Akkermansiaceae bacterium]
MRNKSVSFRLILGVSVLLWCGAIGLAQAQAGGGRIPVLIKFKDKPGAAEQALVEASGGRIRHVYGLIPAIAAEMPMAAAEALMASPRVELVERDQLLHLVATPDDPRFPELWGLDNTGQTGGITGADISAVEAWDITTNSGLGAAGPIIAIVDSGAEVAPGYSGTAVTHPDLQPNLWINGGEVAGNGVDDDNNGFIDDIHGFNFYDNASWLYYSANEDFHGTHVAGTIGAAGNNSLGVTGINWEARLMILKFIGPGGSGSTSDAIAAIEYAAANGASVINASWGGGGFTQTLKDAIEASECVFAAAAGNGGMDGIGDDTDLAPHYPSAYASSNIIAVAATDHLDDLAGFSNFGATSVDLGAPGVNILSTYPGGTYDSLNGTSMATPHVAGVAGLIYGMHPDAGPEQVRHMILSSVDPVSSLNGRSVTGGRLNAYGAVLEELPPGPPPPPPPPPPTPDLAAADVSSSSSRVDGAYTDTHAQDGVYQSIVERESGGPRRNRHDFLAHIWSVNLTNGNFRLHVDAHRSDGGDADSEFIFDWSSSTSGPWTEMFRVSSGSDTDTYQTYDLSTNSGVVYVRARDDDQTSGEKFFDTLKVDHMYVDGGDGSGEPPPPPPPGDTTPPVISNVASAAIHKNGNFEITWTTDESATSDVLINLSLFLDPDPEMVTSHRRVFKGARGASYVYFVESVDAAGNTSGAVGPFVHQN